jgi:hypothetical protein
MLAGSNRDSWLKNLGARLGKGLTAGFALGLAYMVILNIIAAILLPDFWIGEDVTGQPGRYVSMMWTAGPIALGLAGGLFLILIRWAVGLTRVRIVLLEDVPSATAKIEQTSPEPGAATSGGRDPGF